jgi:hypothetical protein
MLVIKKPLVGSLSCCRLLLFGGNLSFKQKNNCQASPVTAAVVFNPSFKLELLGSQSRVSVRVKSSCCIAFFIPDFMFSRMCGRFGLGATQGLING